MADLPEPLNSDERQELERLRRWKAEALPVLAGLQELGGALGLPLGASITGRTAVDAALDLRNRAQHTADAVAAALARVKRLPDEWETAADRLPPGSLTGGVRYSLARELRAALPEGKGGERRG